MKPRTASVIDRIIKKRKLEDAELIRQIDVHLKNRRGYVFRLPPPHTPVILLLSGGLDSTITWGYLMETYHLSVYPLFLRRGQKREKLEEAAVDYFSAYFRQHYPTLHQEVVKLKTPIPPQEIHSQITIPSNNIVDPGTGQYRGIPCYSTLLTTYAVQYGYYLELTRGIRPRTIFTSFMASDGLVMRDETLTAMRSQMFNVCTSTNDYSWQITSLPLEKELGFFYDKSDFIRWGVQAGYPLEKTRSCIRWQPNHCGSCISCHLRQYSFKTAGVPDPTIYTAPAPPLIDWVRQKKTGLIRRLSRWKEL